MNRATSAARLDPHPAGQRLGILILETRRVDHSEIDAEQGGVALPPVARHAGSIIDERELLAHKPVEQRGLADIGAADDRDDRELGHRASLRLV
jgi:hypothetical protein